MLFHLFNLIGRSFGAIPGSLGSTWLGVLFPIGVALLGEAIGVFLFGWKAMSQNWKKATGIGFSALGVGYTVLLFYCLVEQIYSDHIGLVASAGAWRQRLEAGQKSVNDQVQAALKPKDTQIEQLKIDCAQNIGAGNQMQRQIADEQSQLNTCLLQQKEIPTFKVFPIGHDQKPGLPKMEYVLTTNTIRTPVDLIASCDIPIAGGSVHPMTTTMGSISTNDERRLSATRYKFSLLSPPWSPSGPLWVTIFFIPPVNGMPSCLFSLDAQ